MSDYHAGHQPVNTEISTNTDIHKNMIRHIFKSKDKDLQLVKVRHRDSLVVQWIRICLPIQVHSLVWEDHTCHGATKPVHHNHGAHALGWTELI